MGKKKKKILKRVNPEKSNKMIIAVAIGLIIILAFFITMLVTRNEPVPKEDRFAQTVEKLHKVEGIITVEPNWRTNEILVVADGSVHDDFKALVKYHGEVISKRLMGETVTMMLAIDNKENTVYSVTLKNGQQISESQR